MKRKFKYKIIDTQEWELEIKNITPISRDSKNGYVEIDKSVNTLVNDFKIIEQENINIYQEQKYDVFSAANCTYHEFDCDGENKKAYIKNGINKKVLKKLKRIANCPVIDLHGYNVSSAYGILMNFIYECYMQSEKYILIIHGKGLSSPNQQPVLKPKVLNWLEEHGLVYAFIEASIQQGGSGSTMVLLKSNYDN